MSDIKNILLSCIALLWFSHSYGQYYFDVDAHDNQEQLRAKHKIKRLEVKGDGGYHAEYTFDDKGCELTCTYTSSNGIIKQTTTYNTSGQKQRLIVEYAPGESEVSDFIYGPHGLKYKTRYNPLNSEKQDSTIFNYNAEGLLVEIKNKYSTCHLSYDKENRVNKNETFDLKWDLSSHIEYTYNEKGWIDSETWFSMSGDKFKTIVWEYDKNGSVKKKMRVISDIAEENTYEYDSRGLLVKMIKSSPDYSYPGENNTSTSTFTYEYFLK